MLYIIGKNNITSKCFYSYFILLCCGQKIFFKVLSSYFSLPSQTAQRKKNYVKAYNDSETKGMDLHISHYASNSLR